MSTVREALLVGDTDKDQKLLNTRALGRPRTQVAATSKKTLLGL